MYPEKFSFRGDFAARAEKLWERLHADGLYSPDKLYQPGHYSWPGDFEGRTLLAWALCGRLLGKTSPYLAEVMQKYNAGVNDKGYFGTVYQDGTLDEQQLAGHGWLLRALSEHYLDTHDSIYAKAAADVLRNLVLPLRGKFASYPVSDGVRLQSGAASGSRDRKVGDWLLSTDVGAVFILLDGALQASGVFGVDLGTLPEEMIGCFRKIDLRAMRVQTHATLTFLRGVLRFLESKDDPELLKYAENLFDFYCEYGMTENYANDNWFGRPEWTEPCAVIDSFMSAMVLARLTGKEKYLDFAHRIWFSGVERSQRVTGGMGCDSCLHDDHPVLAMKLPEATWCCTMRAGEGFFACGKYSLMRDGNELKIFLPLSGSYTFADGLTVEVETAYPLSGMVNVKIEHSGVAEIEKISVFTVEHGWENPGIAHGEYPLLGRKSRNGGKTAYWRGAVMYGKKAGTDEFIPVNTGWQLDMEELEKLHLQMLF